MATKSIHISFQKDAGTEEKKAEKKDSSTTNASTNIINTNNAFTSEILSDFEIVERKFSGGKSVSTIDINEYRNLFFSPIVQPQIFQDYLLHVYRGLKYIPKIHLSGPPPDIRIELDPFKRLTFILILAGIYKTLFLDLDETLVHACKSFESNEITLKVSGKDGKIVNVLIST